MPGATASLERWRGAERARLVAARTAADPAKRRAWDAAIETAIESVLPAPAGLVLGLYWPCRGEFDARPLAARLAAAGATTALPAVTGRHRPLEFRRWAPGDPTEPGAFSIPVPVSREAAYPDALLVPLVGFDRDNYRLGFGGGFYDVTLAALDPRPLTVGVGYELSRLATIRPQPHDVALDVVVTEAGVQRRTRLPGPSGR